MILNLLPIPALDGGRLLFIGAEAIRGRRVEPAREALVHLIGFMLLVGLMVLLTVADVSRFL
jgi:regulator of sigma E protease